MDFPVLSYKQLHHSILERDRVGRGEKAQIKTAYVSNRNFLKEPTAHTWSPAWEFRKVCSLVLATGYI